MRESPSFLLRGSRRLLLALALMLTGCAGARPPKVDLHPLGYVVLGPEAPTHLGLGSGDTLFEIASSGVPETVRASAARWDDEFLLSKDCNRYFRFASTFLVVLVKDCRPGASYEDGQVLVVMSGSGAELHGPVPWLVGDIAAIYPPLQ